MDYTGNYIADAEERTHGSEHGSLVELRVTTMINSHINIASCLLHKQYLKYIMVFSICFSCVI